jgi:hypothetical protein
MTLHPARMMNLMHRLRCRYGIVALWCSLKMLLSLLLLTPAILLAETRLIPGLLNEINGFEAIL